MRTTGWFSNHLDALMGVGFEDLEGLSVREKREIIKKRATDMNNIKTMKFKYHNRGQGAVMLAERLNR